MYKVQCTDPARPLARHAPGTDVVVSNDAVLDTDWAEAHVAHSLLASLVRDNRSVNLYRNANMLYRDVLKLE